MQTEKQIIVFLVEMIFATCEQSFKTNGWLSRRDHSKLEKIAF